MEIKTETTFDCGDACCAFSLKRQKYVELDGGKHVVGLPERVAVMPGDFETVEGFAPDLLPIFKNIWTEDVISRHKARLAACASGECHEGHDGEESP